MKHRIEHSLLAGVALASLLPGLARAQSAPVAEPPAATEHYGGNIGTTTIPAAGFAGLPAVDPDGFAYISYVFPVVFAGGYAAVDLPNGAEITQLCAVITDATFCGSAGVYLLGWEYPATPGAATTPRLTLATAASDYGSQPGTTVLCTTPPTPIRLLSYGNLDGDADSGWTAYRLQAYMSFGPCGGVQEPEPRTPTQVGFGAAVVHWRRTISAAPAVATFSDVPTSHPFFRFVEALTASGITGGCGGGRYCPDATVTRGQMAVFLATALGLHYPN